MYLSIKFAKAAHEQRSAGAAVRSQRHTSIYAYSWAVYWADLGVE